MRVKINSIGTVEIHLRGITPSDSYMPMKKIEIPGLPDVEVFEIRDFPNEKLFGLRIDDWRKIPGYFRDVVHKVLGDMYLQQIPSLERQLSCLDDYYKEMEGAQLGPPMSLEVVV